MKYSMKIKCSAFFNSSTKALNLYSPNVKYFIGLDEKEDKEDKKDKKAPYGYEIKMLKEQTFNPNLLEDILNQVGY